MSSYNRVEHYNYYMEHDCALAMTINVDVTKLVRFIKKNNLHTYPILLWVISRAVNSIPECRFTIDSKGQPAIYNQVNPAYVAWNKDTNTFYCVSTPYSEDLISFYMNCRKDIETNKNKSMFPQGVTPPNVFSITVSSEIIFTGMSIHVRRQPLTPMFAVGKIYRKGFRRFAPICIQVNHAACDMHHIYMIIEEIYKAMKELKWESA